jgi:hypothetical protein
VAWSGIAGVGVAVAWAVIGYLTFVVKPGYRAGSRGYGMVAGGDHMYYGSMLLQFSGTPYARSLQETARAFHYPLDWHRLNLGYLNPQVAPLIYPRPAQSLIGAVFEPAFGVHAIVVPGILAAVAVPFAVLMATRRLQATRWVAIPLILMLLTQTFDENGAGVYPEALLGLCLVGAAATLPWDRRRASVTDLCWLTFFIVLGTLTRQMSPAFIGLVIGALAWGLVFQKDRRRWWRSWLAPSALTTVVAGAGALITQWWAPYDVLAWTQTSTGASTRMEGLVRGVLRIPSRYDKELAHYFRTDPAFLALVVLGLFALLYVFRHPVVGAFLGVAAPLLLTVGLNGTAQFRYPEPALPILVLVIALALSKLSRRGVHAGRAPSAPEAERARRPRVLAVGLSVTPLVLAATLVVATFVVYQPSRAVQVGDVTASDLKGPWPLTVPRLALSCGGDDGQVWGVTPGGKRVSVTGTAMARSLGTPSVTTMLKTSDGKVASVVELVSVAVDRCPVPVPQR